MISYYNNGKVKRPSFQDVEGRIVLVSDGTRQGLSGVVVLVSTDDGRAVIGHEVERTYSAELKRFTYSQNKAVGGRTRVERSAIRVACDTVAEVDAVREVVRVMEANIWQETKAAERRIAALEGASIASSGPVVMVELPEGSRFLDKNSGEAVHFIKENEE
ncbi:hypothetical protein [Rhizobium leguminosarum]|uniref:hypothetical protein n=1 Tax=Rhizobium leguminosarum TaxID=384 RepID=UPI002E0FC550|nr:hypothetical protein U8Q02_42530 [Rhizobium leguminosarum]